MTKIRRTAGFTLVEVMVVIVIIGLLATVVLINVLPAREHAMVEKARVDVSRLEAAVELYRLQLSEIPSTAQGLKALTARPEGLTHPEQYPAEPFVKRLEKDPWGADYQYASPGKHGRFDIWSWGADGKEGGEGHDADIGNW